MIDLGMRRVRWVGAGVGLFLIALAIGVLGSRRCLVVVYNETNAALVGVVVRGSGTEWRVPLLEEGSSRQQNIRAELAPGVWEVTVGLGAGEEAEVWFEPGPGRRLVVRVFAPEIVEFDLIEGWWN